MKPLESTCECGGRVLVVNDRQFEADPQFVLTALDNGEFDCKPMHVEHVCADALDVEELTQALGGVLFKPEGPACQVHDAGPVNEAFFRCGCRR